MQLLRLSIRTILFCSIAWLSCSAYAFASNEKALTDSANALYLKGNYEHAAKAYEQVLAMGFESPEVYFNLGNAYFKLNEVGSSVLNYERAKKLNPRDEDIRFNLQLVNQQTVDKIEPPSSLFLDEWWNGIKNMHSEKTWSIRSIIFFALSFLFLGTFLSTSNQTSKLFSFWLTIAFVLLSAITFIIAKSNYDNLTSSKGAVVLSSTIEVKNIPSENGTKLFLLHEGAKVNAPETTGEWVKIELSPEKVGWVKRKSVEFI